MLSTHPHLSILRPSPTTVSYIVSTSLPPQSLASHFTHWLFLLSRVLLGTLTLLLLSAKYLDPTPQDLPFLPNSLRTTQWTYIVPLSIGVLLLVFRRFHTGMCTDYRKTKNIIQVTHSPL